MEITTNTIGETTVLRIQGSIDSTESSQLNEIPCLKTCSEDVVIDLSDVDFMDSMGLGVLVGIIRGFTESDNSLVFTSPRPIVLKTLSMTGIDRIITIADSVDDALATLKS